MAMHKRLSRGRRRSLGRWIHAIGTVTEIAPGQDRRRDSAGGRVSKQARSEPEILRRVSEAAAEWCLQARPDLGVILQSGIDAPPVVLMPGSRRRRAPSHLSTLIARVSRIAAAVGSCDAAGPCYGILTQNVTQTHGSPGLPAGAF
jgi:hypothetical protein